MNRFELRFYLETIIENTTKIVDFVGQMDEKQFLADEKTMFAVIKLLENIGEAAKFVPDSWRRKYNQIEWEAIVGMRNILIHEYFGIDAHAVWQVVKKDLPILQTNLTQFIKEI